ncbi:MAG: hypothetical protein LBT89_09775 [Planctomycetaceae bacterium]|jgi:hypothetical protein|nr:hypothetical protein [Planctomycetaceae bacterium]
MRNIVTSIGQYFRSQVQSLTEPVVNSALDAAKDVMHKALADWQRNWLLNIIESLTLECLVIGIALICHFFLRMNHWAVFVISLLVLTIMFRSIVRYVTTLWKYRKHRRLAGVCIKTCCQTLVKHWSFDLTLKETIRCVFLWLYNERVAAGYQKIHSIVSVIGIPSRDELADKAVQEFFKPVRDYIVRLFLYEAGGLTLFYGVFFCLLKNYVFAITAHLSTAEVILFPFTVVIPELWAML